ncbi:hypothetical protein C8T65DRAFT_719677 [Cerioporus squamosus]|nr:hypothetical protein C8T65DRAFT_719677 [Cerioporus squamosus]
MRCHRASRGLGLALIARLVQDASNIVIAACRHPENARALRDLAVTAKGQLHIVRIDLLADDKPFSMSTDALIKEFVTNVAGPVFVSQIFLPLVEKSTRKTIVNVSGSLGSIGIGYDVRCASYSITKTALNMLVIERPDLTIISLDPAWVKTELGGPDAPIEVEDSISGIINVLGSLKHEDSGAFISYNGTRLHGSSQMFLTPKRRVTKCGLCCGGAVGI